jgi:hypothetical protein
MLPDRGSGQPPPPSAQRPTAEPQQDSEDEEDPEDSGEDADPEDDEDTGGISEPTSKRQRPSLSAVLHLERCTGELSLCLV